MIDLKRNSKGEFVEATGLNSQAWRIYKPNQKKDFPISRSGFEDFKKCPRCFYLKIVKGFQEPGMPQFKLNELTDTLLKKEFSCMNHNRNEMKFSPMENSTLFIGRKKYSSLFCIWCQ